MWIQCDTCDGDGDGTCPDGCCECPDCDGFGGADFPDHDPDF